VASFALGGSQDRGGQRLQNMPLTFETTTAPPHSLSAPELQLVQRVWQRAGWPPVDGYGTLALAAVVAANRPLAEVLTSVDLDDASSVANAVRALHEAR